MSYILMPSGGCINTKGLQIGDPADAVHWDPGIYAKIEYNQESSPTWFPNPYTNQSTSVYGQLDNKTWYKGILHEANFGDINTSGSTFDFTDLAHKFEVIKGLGKKIMLLLTFKVTEVDRALRMLPSDLDSTSGNYSDGTTPKYHYLWNYLQGSVAKGYHMDLFLFQDGLTGEYPTGTPIYTFRDRYYAFLQEIADRFANHADYKDTFAGIMTTESASMTQQDSFVTGNSVNNHYKGRIALLKKLKQMFPNHIVMDDCNFNSTYVDVMTKSGTSNAIGTYAADGLVANKISYTNSNFHTGTNLIGLKNIAALQGQIPIVMQIQALDEDSRNGGEDNYYNWQPTPPGYGDPDGVLTDGATNPTNSAAPDLDWIIDRSRYYEANYLVVQHNKAGGSRFDWDDFVTAMDATAIVSPNTGGSIKDDPYGGMNITEPTNIV